MNGWDWLSAAAPRKPLTLSGVNGRSGSAPIGAMKLLPGVNGREPAELWIGDTSYGRASRGISLSLGAGESDMSRSGCCALNSASVNGCSGRPVGEMSAKRAP